jgi:hypothetical protein
MRHNRWTFGENWLVTKVDLLLRPKQFFVPVSPLIAAWFLKRDNWHSFLHAAHGVEVWTKSGCNEGHLSLEDKTVFLHCSGVTETCDVVLTAHTLRASIFRLKSVSNEDFFSLEAERIFVVISSRIGAVRLED